MGREEEVVGGGPGSTQAERTGGSHRLTYSRNLEGVLVAKKDFNLPKHQDIDTKNLFVRCPHSRYATFTNLSA